MYLRETRRTNRDGSVVSYLQLAHNERHPDTGTPVAKVIHNFGRADTVDRDALARLVSSISRFLTPEQAAAAAHDVEVEVLGSRRVGGSWTLDRLWERLGIGAAIRRVANRRRLATRRIAAPIPRRSHNRSNVQDPPTRREPRTSTSTSWAAAAACSGVRNREIEDTNRARASRSTVSARPKLWITFATGVPVSGCRSLWASCR